MLSIAAAEWKLRLQAAAKFAQMSAAAFDFDLDSGGNVTHETREPQ